MRREEGRGSIWCPWKQCCDKSSFKAAYELFVYLEEKGVLEEAFLYFTLLDNYLSL